MSTATRRKAMRWGLVAAVAAIIAAAGWTWREQQITRTEGKRASQPAERERVQRQVAREKQRIANQAQAKTFLSEARLAGNQRPALAYLARALLLDPESSAIKGLTAAMLTRLKKPRPNEPLDHDTAVDSAAFSPDGRWALTTTEAFGMPLWEATKGGGARVWEATTGRLIHDLFHQDENVVFARFSGDGRRVVTIRRDGTALIVETTTGQPVGRPLRHPTKIRTAALSAGGSRVVTVASGVARVWDTATGQRLGEQIEHEDLRPPRNIGVNKRGIVSATFSPHGERILTLSETYGTSIVTARVWDTETGRLLSGPLHDGNHRINSASFSRDGELVVTASDRGVARVWEAATGEPVGEPLRHRLDGGRHDWEKTSRWNYKRHHGEWVIEAVEGPEPDESEASYSTAALVAAALSHDGEKVVTASRDATARLFEVASGRQIAAPMQHAGAVTSASFSPNGFLVVTASADKTVRLWDAATGRRLGLPQMEHADSVTGAAFSDDGLRLITHSRDGTARVWPVLGGRSVGMPLRHQDQVSSASFSADGRRVVTASRDSTARIWDAATGEQLGPELRHEDREVNVSVSGAATGEPVGSRLAQPDLDRAINSASFSADGRWLVTTSASRTDVNKAGTARVWDAATGEPAAGPLRHERGVDSASFSPDGKWLVTISARPVEPEQHPWWVKSAQVWDWAAGEPVGESMPYSASASFSLDGRRIVTTDSGSIAQVWDAATGQSIGEPLRHVGLVRSTSWSPDGQSIVTASEDKSARVWEVATSEPAGEPMRHEGGVNSASFSADGRRVVTASQDGTARVWDALTGLPVGEPMRPAPTPARTTLARTTPAPVASASFSPDGQLVVTASRGGVVQIWEAATGRSISSVMVHYDDVVAASFGPDGQRVVTASADGSARVWDVGLPACSPDELELITELAEVKSGYQLSDDGDLEALAPQARSERLAELRRLVWSESTGCVAYVGWHLEHPYERTISPFSKMTVYDYLWRLPVTADEDLRWQALAFHGHHLVAHIRP